MKTILSLLALLGLAASNAFGQTKENESIQYSEITELNPSDTLFRVYKGEWYEMGVPCGYVNQKGDTIIPIGKYRYCIFDTVRTYTIVGDPSDFHAIDQKGNRLYEVNWFDNGPDYLKDGLFRIIRNNKMGHANAHGEIVIEPQFDCANAFENGIAKVSLECNIKKFGEHREMISKSWFYIDKTGTRIN